MRQSTTVRFLWKAGIAFADLSKRLWDFGQKEGLVFDRFRDFGGNAPFMVETLGPNRLETAFVESPWAKDPLLEPRFFAAFWNLQEPDGTEWGEFIIRREYNPGDRVMALRLSFDWTFEAPYLVSRGLFDRFVRKYHQIKELFGLLDCDEVHGFSRIAWDDADSGHERKDFRFAKEGRQILVRQVEERRPLPESRAGESRIIIDG